MDTRTFTPYTAANVSVVRPYGGIADSIMPMADYQHYYRAILDLDGLSWSSRFVTLLCYNSVVVKVEPEFVDNFHFDLQPWVHYIPVRADLSDLHERAAFATDPANDTQVLRIIANANAWCHTRIVQSRLAEDMLDTWSFYVEQLYKHDPNWLDRWNEAQQHAAYVREAHTLDAEDVVTALL